MSVSLSKRDWFQNDTSYHPASSSNSSYRLCLEEQHRRYLRSQFISFKLSKRFEFPRQHAAPCHHRVRWMPSSSARASLASPAACCESLPSDTLREAALRTPTQIYDKLGYSRLYFTFFLRRRTTTISPRPPPVATTRPTPSELLSSSGSSASTFDPGFTVPPALDPACPTSIPATQTPQIKSNGTPFTRTTPTPSEHTVITARRR